METEVEVLLLTFNGDSFLAEQLDSLINQREVQIHLTVSDDGSTDETIRLLQRYENRFKSFQILSGPRNGPWENYRFLIRNRRTRHPVAFCDQDDIWHPKKIKTQFQQIPNIDEPYMVSTNVCLFGKRKFGKLHDGTYQNHLIRNISQGCTQLMTSPFADLLEDVEYPEQFPSDWWHYIIAKEIKCHIFHDECLVFYRIHDSNFIGVPSKFAKFKKLFNIANRYHLKFASMTEKAIVYLDQASINGLIKEVSPEREMLRSLLSTKGFTKIVQVAKLLIARNVDKYTKLRIILFTVLKNA